MEVLFDNMGAVLSGFLMTLRLLIFGGLGAMLIGLVVATMRISPVGSLRMFATAYTELIRNIPLTLLLFFMTFVLPLMLQVRLRDPQVVELAVERVLRLLPALLGRDRL